MSISFLVPAEEELNEYAQIDCLQGLANIHVSGQPTEGRLGSSHEV